ncbi:MAG: M48 family metalloprotease [Gammaproteobacteria bacterium]|nr:M48 family metalloprotease [Gammaproteobacteria bacterium]
MSFVRLDRRYASAFTVALLLGIVVACARNPVTGKTELQLVSEQQEIQIGAQNYLASRQSQGGDWLVDAELNDYIDGVGKKLVKVSDRPELPYEFKVLNNSVPNAWALPGGKIAVNRGLLLELNNEAELAAVLGHEIVHAAARHGAKAMERGMLLQAGVLGLGVAAGDKEGGALLVGAGALGAQLIGKKYSRDAELESDRYGITYMARVGYDPRAAISLQETFVRLFKGEKSNWLEGMFASHPPSPERVEANKATAAKFASSGTLGAESYQARIAVLKKSREAYNKFDEGRKALAANNPDAALAAAEAALKIEPREALFYGLRGDAKIKQKRLLDALTDFDLAIGRNRDYFQFYLQRGLIKQQLRDAGARADLEKSVALLPTAVAHLALGDDALKRNDKESAKQNFALAAQSESDTGKRATLQLARLDLSEHPEKYIGVDAARDARGFITVSVQNRSPVKIKNLKVAVALFDAAGQIAAQDSLLLSATLDPRASITESTRVGPLPTDLELSRVRVKIFSAELAE